MLKILKANEEYENNIKKYTKKDGILALILFAIMIIMCVLQGVLYNKFNFIKDNIRLVGCLFYLLLIVISILFVKLSKQKLDTIGFKVKYYNWWNTVFNLFL